MAWSNVPLFPHASVAKKVTTAVTGLLLIGFLCTHLAGNLLLFVGQPTFNAYAHMLSTNPLIYLAEVGLLLILIYHVVIGIMVTLENRAARPVAYEQYRAAGEQTLFSRNMIWSGAVVFCFLVLHIVSFKFGPAKLLPTGEKDLWTLVVTRFENGWYSSFYVIAMVLLGGHLAHAFQSAVRTVGVTQATFRHDLRRFSYLVAAIFVIGFGTMPTYFYFRGEQVRAEAAERARQLAAWRASVSETATAPATAHP